MQITVDVSEELIRKSIQERVDEAVSTEAFRWGVDEYTKTAGKEN